ncbi:hypothetical protein CAter282_2713 [Collimonas arenae]|uniref:DUF3298 domain-containing protein n=1 Tax=Collimonas arenae TaxID=279058 RepID=A0A127QK90_9BURK|nr:hypothetical protein [Collimonas arenae]AMP00560.1 hypothetical protein CAter10_2988 [Collimonas arenae]AMP10443.1 hypothetical protein CAter282_2713 [Collimonas arenae]
MRLLLFPLLSVLSVGYAVAGTDATQLAGVWQGKLGNADIVACFNQAGADSSSGSYYYVRHKTPIQLMQKTGQSSWMESGGTGSWSLGTPENGHLDGTWRAPKGGAPLALALTSVSGGGTENACGSDAYNRALESFPALQIGKTQDFEGKKYRNLRVADVVTIELQGSGDGLVKVNQKLRAILPRKAEDLADYFATRRRYLSSMGTATEDETSAEPVFWSSRWITVNFYRWAAGYGRNGIMLDYRTWDLRTGDEIQLWDWFAPKSADGGLYRALPERLQKYLFKGVAIDKECRDGYKGEGQYRVSLTANGIEFWEEAFGTGCEQDFVIPYAKLGPFLTSQGKAALRDLGGI